MKNRGHALLYRRSTKDGEPDAVLVGLSDMRARFDEIGGTYLTLNKNYLEILA